LKPWLDSTNEERLNGENGLLLTPSIDHLFDRGFIGFEDSGMVRAKHDKLSTGELEAFDATVGASHCSCPNTKVGMAVNR
jgi:hypothetical protein